MSNVFFTFATPVLLLCYLLSSAAALVLVDFEDCANAVNNSYFNNPSVDYLRDQNGNPTYNISTAWGITYQACTDICTSGQAFMEWNAFSTQVSTWLLPWLSLTAQLPFETKSTTMNFQALYLALGCPLLIIYSLGLTILNARSINRQVRQLKESEDISKIPLEPRAELLKVLDNARTVLIETQSVPLRVVNGPKRQIAQLVVNPNYGYWWTKIAEGILRTKREWTYSLSAQLALVITAQLFSIIDYFTSPADDTSITVGLALNSVWIWMIPVTLGFVRVGTQTSAGSIKTALKSVNVPDLGEKESTIGLADKTRYVTFEKRSPSMRHCSSDYVSRLQERSPLSSCVRVNAPLSTEIPSGSLELPERRGGNSTRSADLESGRMLEVPSQSMSGDTGQASSAETLLPGLEREQTLSPLSSQGWLERLLTISFHGDESEPGPIYNYARVWSHRNVVAYLIGAFECSIRKQANKRVVRPGTAWNHVPGEYNRNLEGNAEQLSKFISDEERDEIKPPSHSLELPGLVKDLILVASTTTILFWSTTGSGILIAYETPTVGLGCDSGGYLLYGVAATFSWLLIVSSSFLSHLYAAKLESGHNFWWCRSIAAIVCYAGKFVAGLNAFFLLCISFFQFTNLYDTCWCSTSIISLHDRAWLALFASDSQIVAASRAPWVGGIIWVVVVVAVSSLLILFSRGDELADGNLK